MKTTNNDTAKGEADRNDSAAQREKTGIRSEEVVSIGKSVVVKSGDTAGTVVVIGGSATIDGKVDDTVVAIGGDVPSERRGFGHRRSVLGNIKLGPEAKIGGEAVSVGGKIDKAEEP
jgi:hypothetical protein